MNSLAIQADSILTQLRQKGINSEVTKRLGITNFRSVFLFTFVLCFYIAFGFIESLISPNINSAININAFQDNILATVVFLFIGCIILSLIIAFCFDKTSKLFVNSERIETQSHLGEVNSRVKIAIEIAKTANETSVEVAESFLKANIDILNDRLSFLSLLTLMGVFMAGSLSFLEFNETGSKFISACVIWIVLLVRLVALSRLYILREWLSIISIIKALVKLNKNE